MYLTVSEAGFREQRLGDIQALFAKPNNSAGMLGSASAAGGLRRDRGGRPTRDNRDFVARPGEVTVA
jgi:hypothetical protein